ncbi:ABC transporter permease [Dactylosporangium sucinum]|uniref:ABC transporter permease n=1 Tax=Dactylosporangium sucinum TaxID=1424081 RepID=A0A917X3F6_9ACTN|nr:ABC transporter permease [Dactylosporangium sucinum]GGM58920.1 ABC transporter permease [Dactylosporangium sucinum]
MPSQTLTRAERQRILRTPGRHELAPERWMRLLRLRDLALGAGVPLLLAVLWQVACDAGWIDRRLYPSPLDIIRTAGDMWQRDTLWPDLLASLRRTGLGYVIGSAVGALFGVAMGLWRPIRAALDPLLNALYTVPKLALLPVFLTVFGFGELPVVALIAVTVFFFIWISTMSAMVAVPEGYREAGVTLNLSTWQMFRHVMLPAALPEIFVGLRIAAGVSVLILVGVEFVLGGNGLGHVIEQGRTTLVLGQTYVGIVVVALVGLVFSVVVQLIGRLLMPWSRAGSVMRQL